LRQLGASQAAALFGGVVVLLDNALLVQTRLIALDGLLLVATFGSLAAALWLGRTAQKRWLWLSLLVGALAALAVGTKLTGLVAPGLLGLLWLVKLWQVRKEQLMLWLKIGAVALLAGLVVYVGGFALHFALLTEPGTGDKWRVPSFERPIITNFVNETVELHKLMFNANYGLTASHPDASTWWEWPLMRTSVFYWAYSGGGGRAGAIYLLGNPVVWWGSSVLLVVAFLSMGYGMVRSRSMSMLGSKFQISNFKFQNLMWVPIIGYLLSYVPLMRVPRALFLYHYFTPLLFAWLIIILWLQRRGFFGSGSVRQQPGRYWLTLTVLAVLFTVFSPLTYGFLLLPEVFEKLFWFKSWR